MKKQDIANYLISFYDYDSCGSDFGIKNNNLKLEVLTILDNMDYKEESKLISDIIMDNFLNDKAIVNGYGWEDVKEFLGWYENIGNYI